MTEALVAALRQVAAQGTARHDWVLAVNAGSSSLKLGLYAIEGAGSDLHADPPSWSATLEGLEPGGRPRWRGRGMPDAATATTLDAALQSLATALEAAGVRLAAVAHRIVHGGDRCTAPAPLDADTMSYLRSLSSLAPLHQPANLAGVDALRRALPGVPAIGCFDTAFHATLPELERRLPLPELPALPGLRRYGFHGLSYDYLAQTLAARTPAALGRAVLAHLGNGSSLCATEHGRSVATTMGFSALDGLMMGTRSGSLDPGVVLHLWAAGWSRDDVERLLYRESGLKGVSGLSADWRRLRASDAPGARLALELFTHRARREAGALMAVLGGLDLVAWTGGIGEHDAALRAAMAEAWAVAGLRLDAEANAAATGDAVCAIHASDSRVEAWVVPTDEGRVAAQGAARWLAARGNTGLTH